MNNVDFLAKLNPSRRNAVLAALNRVQMLRGNPVMNWDYFNKLRRDEKHTLLEENEFFAVTYNMIFYHMIARAERFKNESSRKFAEDYVKEIFGLGTVSNQKYALSQDQRTRIRQCIDKMWSV